MEKRLKPKPEKVTIKNRHRTVETVEPKIHIDWQIEAMLVGKTF